MMSKWKRRQEEKRRQQRIMQHHRRVLSQRPLVDTTAPRSMSFKHMKVNKKKLQMKRDRQQQIWKHNQDINEALVDIETRERGTYTDRAAINNKSLRLRARLDEVEAINRENQRIYDHIVKAQSLGNPGAHAKLGAIPQEGWSAHNDRYEEFRRRLLELPQLKSVVAASQRASTRRREQQQREREREHQQRQQRQGRNRQDREGSVEDIEEDTSDGDF